jgi:hypothetical protein
LFGTFLFGGIAAMKIAGKVELIQSQDRLLVFAGIGPVGWTRTYHWSDFTSVREQISTGRRTSQATIVLEGTRRASLGSLLNEERRYFILSALQRMLASAPSASGGGWIHDK